MDKSNELQKETNILIDKISEISLGEKVTVKIKGYFGGEVNIKATYTGLPVHHGYLSSYGSWGLYKCNNEEINSYQIMLRPYKKKITGFLN